MITERAVTSTATARKACSPGDGIGSLFSSVASRFTFGGQPVETKYVAFVNLREIRGIKFGTPSAAGLQ